MPKEFFDYNDIIYLLDEEKTKDFTKGWFYRNRVALINGAIGLAKIAIGGLAIAFSFGALLPFACLIIKSGCTDIFNSTCNIAFGIKMSWTELLFD